MLIQNSGNAEQTTLQLRKSDAALVAAARDVRRWGTAIGSNRAQRVKDGRWYSLEQFPQLKHHFEPTTQTLYIGSAYAEGLNSKNQRGRAQPVSARPATSAAIGKKIDIAPLHNAVNERSGPGDHEGQTNRLTSPAIASGNTSAASPPPVRKGNSSATKVSDEVSTAKASERTARANCPFLNKSVLNANKVNYQSLLLNVKINGEDLKTAYQFIRRPCGPLLAPILDMRSWRIEVAGSPNVLIDGTHWLNLEEFEGLRYEINTANQEIFLTVAGNKFSSIELDFAPAKQPASRSAKGAFLNYGVNASRNSTGSSTNYSGVVELGAFAPLGSLVSSWGITRFNSNNDVNRINTTFVKDFPLQLERLSIGDINGKPGAWGVGYRLGGIQFGTNFATQPDYQIRPVESLRIIADDPVRLLLKNKQVEPFTDEQGYDHSYYDTQRELPYGPLEIYNLPTFSNGMYTLQGVAADGSITQQSQRYFFNRGLLKQGLHDYSVELGAIRQGGFTDRYDTLVVSATERYGFNRRMTGEVRVEYGDDVIAYGLSLDTVIPWTGVLTTTLAQGQPTNGSFGSRGFQSARLTNRYNRLSYNLSFRHFDRRFIHPGEAKSKTNTLRHSYAAGISNQLPWSDTISLGYNATSSRSARFTDSLSLGYTLNSFNIASASFIYRQELHQNNDWFAVASLSINFDSIARLFNSGNNRRRRQGQLFSPQGSNLSISANKGSNSDLNSRIRLSTNASRNDKRYGLGLSAPLIGEGPYTLSGNYGNRYFETNASISELDGTQTYSAGVTGGLALMGGGIYLTRTLTNSFGLIDLGEDAAGVRVNGIRTNKRGRALIPDLQPYFDNRITVSLDDLPLNAQVEEITTTSRPHFRSGVYIEKEIPYFTDMLVQIVLESGQGQQPLPFGGIVTMDEGSEEFPVGDDGYVYVVGVTEKSVIRVNYGAQSCVIDIPFPEELEPDEIPELGPFVCEGVKP